MVYLVIANMGKRRSTTILAAAFSCAILASPVQLCAQAGGTQPSNQDTTTPVVRGERSPQRGFLGISYRGTPSMSPTGEPRWADFPVVTRIDDGSPAQVAGIQVGDVVVEVNGVDGRVPRLLYAEAIGAKFVIRLRRGDEYLVRDIVSVAVPVSAD